MLKDSISVDPKKVEAIVNRERPTNVHEIMKFLGSSELLSAFYGRFFKVVGSPDGFDKEEC
jgi:hypothetical protein